MATENGEKGGVWEGYSDYRTVSGRMGRSIDEAMDAYAGLERLHTEDERVRGEPAARAGQKILAAALKLIPELKADKGSKDTYEEILGRWLEGEGGEHAVGEVPEAGYVAKLQETRLQRECPEWLYQFVLDIRTAGWELGYLQAGRRTEEEPDDPVEADAQDMFE